MGVPEPTLPRPAPGTSGPEVRRVTRPCHSALAIHLSSSSYARLVNLRVSNSSDRLADEHEPPDHQTDGHGKTKQGYSERTHGEKDGLRHKPDLPPLTQFYLQNYTAMGIHSARMVTCPATL